MKLNIFIPIFLVAATISVRAVNIATWTFETSIPTNAGAYAPEMGSGVGTAVGLGGFSNPVGNGSGESWSATSWGIGDYWQFQVSTLGLNDIVVNYDQTRSAAGSGVFDFLYSLDGVAFTGFATGLKVLENVAANGGVWNSTTHISNYHFTMDLSAITTLDNEANVYFRIRAAIAGSSGSGTVRIDNFAVTGSSIPVPPTTVPETLPFGFAAFTLLVVLGLGYRVRRQAFNA